MGDPGVGFGGRGATSLKKGAIRAGADAFLGSTGALAHLFDRWHCEFGLFAGVAARYGRTVPAQETTSPIEDPHRRGSVGLKVHLALFFVQLAFASQAVESKLAMAPRAEGGEGIDPWSVAMVRMVGAALFFHVWALFRDRRAAVPGEVHPHRVPGKEHRTLFGLSLLGITLNQMLFLMGLKRTSPTVVALLAVAIPVFSTGLAVLFGREKPNLRVFLGLGVASIGVVTLTGLRSIDAGAVLVVVNCLSYAAYVVFSRSAVQRLSAVTVATWIFTWGAITFAPLGLPTLLRDLPNFTARGWLFVVYVIAVPTIFAYVANAWALGRSQASTVTAYIPLQPVLAGLLAWVQLGQPLSPSLVLAGAFILTGVLLVVGVAGKAGRPPAVALAGKRD